MAMAFGKYMDAASIVGSDDDGLPWCDVDIIANCDMEVIRTAENEDELSKSLMSLSWALVHSKCSANINRGIAMLEASVRKLVCPLEAREKLYLLSLGYYRTGLYGKSRENLEACLQIEPDWDQAIILQKLLIERTKKDGAIGMVLATGTIGVLGFAVAGVMGHGCHRGGCCSGRRSGGDDTPYIK